MDNRITELSSFQAECRIQNSVIQGSKILEMEIELTQKQLECNSLLKQLSTLRKQNESLQYTIQLLKDKYLTISDTCSKIKEDYEWIKSLVIEFPKVMNKYISTMSQHEHIHKLNCSRTSNEIPRVIGFGDQQVPNQADISHSSTINSSTINNNSSDNSSNDNSEIIYIINSLKAQNEQLRKEHHSLKLKDMTSSRIIDELKERITLLQTPTRSVFSCYNPTPPTKLRTSDPQTSQTQTPVISRGADDNTTFTVTPFQGYVKKPSDYDNEWTNWSYSPHNPVVKYGLSEGHQHKMEDPKETKQPNLTTQYNSKVLFPVSSLPSSNSITPSSNNSPLMFTDKSASPASVLSTSYEGHRSSSPPITVTTTTFHKIRTTSRSPLRSIYPHGGGETMSTQQKPKAQSASPQDVSKIRAKVRDQYGRVIQNVVL